MILITGGTGFIGSHTARALLDLGESCIITRHHHTEIPEFLTAELGTRLVVEPLDLELDSSLTQIGKRHAVTGIVHLADPAVHKLWRRPDDSSPLQLYGLFDGLARVLRAASDWGVSRVTIASTIGVYGGSEPGIWNEEMPLPLISSHAVPMLKQCAELLASFVGRQFGVDVVSVRPSAIWGPGGRSTSSFFALPALVHAALQQPPETTRLSEPLYAGDGADMCYVKDCGRAIALIQTAETLTHRTYNIGSGRVTTNAEVVEAIRAHIPNALITLTDGRNPRSAPIDSRLDITRIHQDTEYEPQYDIERGIADYITWLRADRTRSREAST